MNPIVYNVLTILLLIASAILQIIALVHNGKNTSSDAKVKGAVSSVKGKLIGSVILQLVVVFSSIGLLVYSKGLMANTILIVNILVLVVAGSLGANSAVSLQCFKEDAHIKKVWTFSTISSILGILIPMLMLLIKSSMLRKSVTSAKTAGQQYIYQKVASKLQPQEQEGVPLTDFGDGPFGF